MNKILTEGQLSDKLYEEISRQNTFYMSIIGILVTLVLTISLAYIWQQLKFSDKGIERMKKSIYEEFEIEDIKGDIKESHENNEKSKDNIENIQKQMDDLEEFKRSNIGALLISNSEQFALTSSSSDEVLINNELLHIRNIIRQYGKIKLNVYDLFEIINNINNGIYNMLERQFDSTKFKSRTKKSLNRINNYLSKQLEFNPPMDKTHEDKVKHLKEQIKEIEKM